MPILKDHDKVDITYYHAHLESFYQGALADGSTPSEARNMTLGYACCLSDSGKLTRMQFEGLVMNIGSF